MGTDTQEEYHMMMQAEILWCVYKYRNTGDYQQHQELRGSHGTDSP